MSIISPDHFLFDTLPEDEATCPDCGGSTRYPYICDYFADPDDKDFYND
ncbi:hypothetical protein [Rothia nasimurium]|nr:hypothetical protein [Rothia nasimurium]